MKSLIRTSYCTLVLAGTIILGSTLAYPQAARTATIQPETKAQLELRDHLSSKLNEVGDTFTAVLKEPLFVNGMLVLPRGAAFYGRITEVKSASRPERSSQMTVVFDSVGVPWGEEPVAVILTAIDDWRNDQKLKATDEGTVKGGRSGDQTVRNVERGGRLGSLGAGSVILIGRGAGAGPGVLAAGGGAIAGGMLGGILMTKGTDVRLNPGTTFRIKFVKPLTLPIARRPQGPGYQPGSNDPGDDRDPPRAPPKDH